MHRGSLRKLTARLGNAEKTIDVRIPPGARNDSKIRIPGGGPTGGDLYVRLRQQPHSQFTVNGDDTEAEIAITPWEAALGSTIQVPTLDGKADIRVPPGVASGQRLRLRGQGLNLRGGGRGDHYVRLKIVVPKELTDAEKKLFQELSRVSDFRPHCGLIDINAINRNARFGPQHVPGTMINRGCATLGKKSQDFVRSPARDPNVISEIGHYNPRVINFPMSVFSGDCQRFIDP